MERLTNTAPPARPSLELSATEPVKPARKDPRGDEKPDRKDDASARAPRGDGLAEQVAAIEKMREDVSALTRNRLKIDRHEESGQFVYRIFNEETGETIRRWPPKNYLELIAFLSEGKGGLLDERA